MWDVLKLKLNTWHTIPGFLSHYPSAKELPRVPQNLEFSSTGAPQFVQKCFFAATIHL
jgi:hypothetical protein